MALKKYFVIYNGKMNTEAGILVRHRPDMPTPAREYEVIKIEGRDGDLYEDKGTFEDITIEVSFNFAAEPDDWNERLRKVKQWIYSDGDRRLILSDDMDYFYNVKIVQISDTERKIKRIGRFTVKFTCEPYAYIKNGAQILELEKVLVNQWQQAEPIYFIYGSGEVKLTVNGKTISATVDRKLTIDTKLGLSYTAENTINNTAISGNYDDLKLQQGDNTFSVNKGFEVYIQPNWRCI